MTKTQGMTFSGPLLALQERERNNCLRRLRSVTPLNEVELILDGKKVLNFSSNDYLGLSKHPFIKEKAIEFVQKFGAGSGASRLVSGNNEIYNELESTLARLKQTEAAVIFSTGFQLNVGVLESLKYDKGSIYCDRLCHNSLLLGAKLGGKRFTRFHHNDLTDLAQRLNLEPNETNWVVTESVFGMDGDLAPLSKLVELQRTKGFRLFVDEAHATGVFGTNGMGLTSEHSSIDLKMGTFSKGLGSFGAYIACSQEMKEFLINFCPALIYSTALPPAALGAIDAALALVTQMDEERNYLADASKYFRESCSALGLDIGNSKSQIIPIIIGDEKKADSLSAFLFEQGFFAPCIKPPTVPLGSARVRVSLSAMHTSEILDAFLNCLRIWCAQGN